LSVVLYTRAGCHLCLDARRILSQQRRRHPFTLQIVEVDTDPDLQNRYGERVPVIVINGKERFRGTVNRILLVRLLNRIES
jgi:glutaredoxin